MAIKPLFYENLCLSLAMSNVLWGKSSWRRAKRAVKSGDTTEAWQEQPYAA